MTIKEQLKNDMKEAMKNKRKKELSTIRLLIDRIQKKEKDMLRDATEDEVITILQTFIKQTDEEKEAFFNRGDFDRHHELADAQELVDKYLPEQLSEDEIMHILTTYTFRSDLPIFNKGSIMKTLMPHVKGKADNRFVSQVVDKFMKERGL